MDSYGYGNGYSGGYEDQSGGYGYGGGYGGGYDDGSYGQGSYNTGYGGGRGGGGRGGRGGRGGSRGGGGGGRKGNANPDYYKDPESEPFRKLFIGGLSYDTSNDSLKSHFEQWGEITDVVVMKDPNTQRSRGFGFVTFKMAQSIDDAQASRPHNIDGREVETKRAMPRGADGQSESSESTKKLFVGGVKDGDTEEDMRDLFSNEGVVEKVDMVTDKDTGKQKPFCFITFEDTDVTDKCVLKHEFIVNGHPVQVKKAQEKKGGMGGGRGGGRGGGGFGRGYNDGGFGQGYGMQGSFGGGPMRGPGYSQRGSGPYGQGYGRGGGGGRW